MASLSGSLRVVCVDDDSLVLSLLADSLEMFEYDFDVETVENPERVPKLVAEDDDIDCIVSDYDMPEMNGLNLFESVRERRADLPFILYTGKGSEEIASEAISAGVTDYLQKDSGTEHYELLANRIREYVTSYRTDQQFALTQERYRRLVEQSVVGIGLSQDGVFEYANPKMAELFGHTVEELVGESVETIVDESDHERLRRAIERRESGEVDSVHYVLTGKGKDGERFDVEVSGSRITYEGEPAVLGVVQRLDTRRKALANVEGSVVEELVAALQDAADNLTRAATDDQLVAARESVLDALSGLRAESVVDLATHCRQTWEQSSLPEEYLDVEGTLLLVGQEGAIDTLFETLWSSLTDVDETNAVTVVPDDHAFQVRVAVGDADNVETGMMPPGISRVAETLGWDVYVSQTNEMVVYGFESVSRAPTPSSVNTA